jgi:crotonobetainyl-CoA:carnitine CoA-transferase CaiB-like acyl-CoA transferase
LQVAVLAYQAMNYLSTGEPPTRAGNVHPNIVPYQPFQTSDGNVIIACGNDNLFRKFCAVANCRHIAEDARFATNADRVKNRAQI